MLLVILEDTKDHYYLKFEIDRGCFGTLTVAEQLTGMIGTALPQPNTTEQPRKMMQRRMCFLYHSSI